MEDTHVGSYRHKITGHLRGSNICIRCRGSLNSNRDAGSGLTIHQDHNIE